MEVVKKTFEKIEIDITGKSFISIIITLIILIIFITIKIVNFNYLNNLNNPTFIKSNYNFKIKNEIKSGYIYASSRGSKYYFYNCKANIKEENKIFFKTELEAKQAGYSRSKTCK